MKPYGVAAIVISCALSAGCQARPNSTDVAPSVAKATEGRQGRPLKVYILAGQSNMTGMVKNQTLEHIKMFPDTAKEFEDLFNEDGTPVVLDDVYVSCWPKKDVEAMGKLGPTFGAGAGSSSNSIGPEYAFGIYMRKELQEPFLIIKTAWGGKSLNHHFRSPSSGEWTPPAGHPDLVKEAPARLPLPNKIDLPADYVPGDDLVPSWYRGRIGKFMGIRPMRGVAIGEVSGVHPIYLTSSPKQDLPGTPFQKGDLILGVDGSALGDDPIQQWRDAFHGSKKLSGDWMITVTRWRKGEIDTFDFDIAQIIEGGRKGLPQYLAELKKQGVEKEKNRGMYYRMMIDHTKNVLADIKRVYPDYDEEAGYEVAGFVWFQGWNDLVDGGTYPNRNKPRGYEQYTWLLENFIRDVRKDIDAPDMPFVIGVLGVGGVEDPPTSNKGYYQQAQAAPADNPEFKGTVAAVHAGRYWDHKLDELNARSHKVRGKRNEFRYKDGLEGEVLDKAYAEYRARHIRPEEEEILKKAVSNAGFHYLGSAKIMAGIGKGFAEAMMELHRENQE